MLISKKILLLLVGVFSLPVTVQSNGATIKNPVDLTTVPAQTRPGVSALAQKDLEKKMALLSTKDKHAPYRRSTSSIYDPFHYSFPS